MTKKKFITKHSEKEQNLTLELNVAEEVLRWTVKHMSEDEIIWHMASLSINVILQVFEKWIQKVDEKTYPDYVSAFSTSLEMWGIIPWVFFSSLLEFATDIDDTQRKAVKEYLSAEDKDDVLNETIEDIKRKLDN